MPWEIAAVLLAGYAAAFFVVPHQIMLATSNRIGVRFHQFRGKFRFAAPARLGLNLAGAVISFGLAFVGSPLWTAIQFGLTIFGLYLLDFRQVERIGRTLK